MGDLQIRLIRPMCTAHLPGNAPPTPTERQLDPRRINEAPLSVSFHRGEQKPTVSGKPAPPPLLHYHRRLLHITSEMWLASNCWLAHSPLSFLSLSNYSHLNNPLAAARRKKWGFLHRPPLALHSFLSFSSFSFFSPPSHVFPLERAEGVGKGGWGRIMWMLGCIFRSVMIHERGRGASVPAQHPDGKRLLGARHFYCQSFWL